MNRQGNSILTVIPLSWSAAQPAGRSGIAPTSNSIPGEKPHRILANPPNLPSAKSRKPGNTRNFPYRNHIYLTRNLSHALICGWAQSALGMEIDQPKSSPINKQLGMNSPLSTSRHKNRPQAVFSPFYPVTLSSPRSTSIHKATTATGPLPCEPPNRTSCGRPQQEQSKAAAPNKYSPTLQPPTDRPLPECGRRPL